MRKYIIGLDIGGTKCAVILADVTHSVTLVDRIAFPTYASLGKDQTISRLFETIHEMLKRHQLQTDAVLGIGVSCGGPLDSQNGVILSPPHLPGWENVPFVTMLEEAFLIPAFLQNDANACALAEWKLGAGQGVNDMVFLTMGTGFGGGIIAEGQLIHGVSDMGGEVGHVRLEADGPIGFGKAGSMEGFCSGDGIAKQAVAYTKKLILAGKTPAWVRDGVADEVISVQELAAYANNGDADAIAIFETAGEKLGAAVSIIMDVLNPARFVIGSIFVRCEHLLRPAMERIIEKEALVYSRNVCQVLPAALGEQLGDYAAVITALVGLEQSEKHGTSVSQEKWYKKAEPGSSQADAIKNTDAQKHLDSLIKRYPCLEPVKSKVFDAFVQLVQTYETGGKLLVCGNGGSAADADHIVGELMKGFFKKRPLPAATAELFGPMAQYLQGALPAIALTQHVALSTAFSNDVHPEMVFAQQVYGYGKKGDVLLGISTSGNSKNVCHALHVAKALGMRTVAFTGASGGDMANLVDVLINVSGSNTAEIQELHLPVYHCLCAMLEEAFFPDGFEL